MRWLNFILLVVAPHLLSTSCVFAIQNDATSQQESDPLAAAWEKLASREPDCIEATLYFSKRPEQTLKYFEQQLKPLRLSEEKFDKLLNDLGSSDESICKKAFEELEYLDPRLLFDLETLMDRVVHEPQRSRIIELIMGIQFGTLPDKEFNLRINRDQPPIERYHMQSGDTARWIWPHVGAIRTDFAMLER